MLSANPDVRSPARDPVVPFTALWLRCNQSRLVQETQSVKDIDLICFKTFPIKAVSCLQVGPMSLDWLVDPFARFDHSRLSLFLEVPSGEQQQGAFPASTRCHWRHDALQAQPQIYAMYYLEHQGSCWICCLQTNPCT